MSPKEWRRLYRITVGFYLLVCVGYFALFMALDFTSWIFVIAMFLGAGTATVIKILFWRKHRCPSCKGRLESRFIGPTSFLFVNIEQCMICSEDLEDWSNAKKEESSKRTRMVYIIGSIILGFIIIILILIAIYTIQPVRCEVAVAFLERNEVGLSNPFDLENEDFKLVPLTNGMIEIYVPVPIDAEVTVGIKEDSNNPFVNYTLDRNTVEIILDNQTRSSRETLSMFERFFSEEKERRSSWWVRRLTIMPMYSTDNTSIAQVIRDEIHLIFQDRVVYHYFILAVHNYNGFPIWITMTINNSDDPMIDEIKEVLSL